MYLRDNRVLMTTHDPRLLTSTIVVRNVEQLPIAREVEAKFLELDLAIIADLRGHVGSNDGALGRLELVQHPAAERPVFRLQRCVDDGLVQIDMGVEL